MAFSRSIFAVACVLACTMHASSALDYSRVWLVDHVEGGNYLFRGDMPINDTNKEDPTFAYDQLIRHVSRGVPYHLARCANVCVVAQLHAYACK